MNSFKMIRNFDESKISGTGEILNGVIFNNGQVCVCWNGKDFNSLGIYPHYFAFYFLHVFKHPQNNTEIIFSELEENPVKKERRKACRFCKQPYIDHPKDLQFGESKYRRSCSGNLVEVE